MNNYLPGHGPRRQQEPSHPRRPARTRLWALTTFSVLTLCSFLFLIVITTGGQLPQFGNGPSWTPPAVAPDQSVRTEVQVPSTRTEDRPFLPGDRVRNVSGSSVNLRRTPGYQNKAPSDVILTIPADDSGVLLKGPEGADGLRWWQVEFAGSIGWMAERSSRGVLLLDLAAD